jgi:hypothetical protein
MRTSATDSSARSSSNCACTTDRLPWRPNLLQVASLGPVLGSSLTRAAADRTSGGHDHDPAVLRTFALLRWCVTKRRHGCRRSGSGALFRRPSPARRRGASVAFKRELTSAGLLATSVGGMAISLVMPETLPLATVKLGSPSSSTAPPANKTG